MIAIKKDDVVQTSDRYEFFEPKTMKDLNGNDVQVLQSIGMFSLGELTRQKEFHLLQIQDIQSKIDTINAS